MTVYRAYLLPRERIGELRGLAEECGVLEVLDHDLWSEDNGPALQVLRRIEPLFQAAEAADLQTDKARRQVKRAVDQGAAGRRNTYHTVSYQVPEMLRRLAVRWSARKLRIQSDTVFEAWMRVMDPPRRRNLFPDFGTSATWTTAAERFLPIFGLKGRDGFLIRSAEELPTFLDGSPVDPALAVSETAALMRRWHHYVPSRFEPQDREVHRARVVKLLRQACRDGQTWWLSYRSSQDANVE